MQSAEFAQNPHENVEIPLPFLKEYLLDPDQRLYRGDTITGITTMADFNTVEKVLIQKITGNPTATRYNTKILKDPLGDLIRPEKFNGSLKNGVITAVSDSEKPGIYWSGKILASADLYSSRGGMIGSVGREINYDYISDAKRGNINRTVGVPFNPSEVAIRISENNVESSQIAYHQEAHELGRVILAGLPGHGKRR